MNKNELEPSQQIDAYIASLSDWRGQLLAKLRKCILQVRPTPVEEWKWNAPVWSHNGLVCSASAFKNHVKLTFFKGAALAADQQKLFNAGLEAKTMRSIDFHEYDTVNLSAIETLVQKAIAVNGK